MKLKSSAVNIIAAWMFSCIRVVDSLVLKSVKREIYRRRHFVTYSRRAMMNPPSNIGGQQVIILAGATSVGKSAVAAELCKILDAEIVLADSVQVYKHLNIGSNKPSPEDMAAVPHHMVDIVEPHDLYSCGDFVRQATPIIFDILERGKVPVVVGGSTMWLQWLTHGVPDAPKASKKTAVAAAEILKGFGGQWDSAVEYVREYDRPRVDKLSRNDWYRLQRCLEIGLQQKEDADEALLSSATSTSSGDSVSAGTVTGNLKRGREEEGAQQVEVQGGEKEGGEGIQGRKDEGESEAESVHSSTLTGERRESLKGLDLRCFFVSEDRDDLYHCIDTRCEDMLLNGLLKEVSGLLRVESLTPDSLVAKAIGYRQTIEYLCRPNAQRADKSNFELYIRNFASATRQYARRQLMWYRKDKAFLWVKIDRKDFHPKDLQPYRTISQEILHWCGQPLEEFDAARKRQIERALEVTLMKNTKPTAKQYRHALIAQKNLPASSRVIISHPVETPDGGELKLGDTFFLPSNSQSAHSSSPTSETPTPVKSEGTGEGEGDVEWVVVQIERTYECLYPRSSDKVAAEQKRLNDLFSANERKALQHIRDSKSGTFDHGVCGIKKTKWSATEFGVRSAEGLKASLILKMYKNLLRTDNPKFFELLNEADSITDELKRLNPSIIDRFSGIGQNDNGEED